MVITQAVQNPFFDVVVAHLEQVAVELFEAYGIPAQTCETEPGLFDPISGSANLAVMGFGGEGIRGALIMMALEPSVVAWMTALGEPGGDAADVLGEFANMLLGRLKARLINEGVTLQVSTPTTASGNGLRLSTPPSLSHWIGLRGDGWDVKVRLDTTFDANFAPREVSSAGAPVEAGDAIFF